MKRGINLKAAVVTGASSGIGLEISKRLLKLKYKVYAIGRDFSKIDFSNDKFVEVQCDLTDRNNMCESIKNIKASGDEIYILVNSAGVGYFGPHEELNASKIHSMVAVNLEAPLIITQMLLRELKKSSGFIINISSITAKISSTYGCAYSATKAGLSHFGEGLFDETRKYGVKVLTIHPDIAKTPFYDNLNFREGDDPESFIIPKCIADAVEMALSQRTGTVITDITIRPQKHMIVKKSK